MARIRSIHPTFPNSYRMQEVSRDVRYFALMLRTIADDEGRFEVDFPAWAKRLYPGDSDVILHFWYAELEGIGYVQSYVVENRDYGRLVHWHDEQQISHPTASVLPRAPDERERECSGNSGTRRRRRQRGEAEQGLADRSDANPESAVFSRGSIPEIVDNVSAIRALDRIKDKAEKDGAYNAAIRAVLEAARFNELATRPDPFRPFTTVAEGDPGDLLREPAPHERFGLPSTNEKA